MNMTPTIPLTPELAKLALDLERANWRYQQRKLGRTFFSELEGPPRLSNELWNYWMEVYGQPI